jgi:hypothetical protein
VVVAVVVVNIVGHFGEEECRAFFDGVVEECWCWHCTASHFDPCRHLESSFVPDIELLVPDIGVGLQLSNSIGTARFKVLIPSRAIHSIQRYKDQLLPRNR